MNRRRLTLVGVIATVLMFICVQSAFGNHAVLVDGTASLNYTYGIDFDTGTYNDPGPSAIDDVFYEIASSSMRWVAPINNTKLLRMTSKPGYMTCAQANLSSTDHWNVKYSLGRWFCVKTNQGRFARFRIDSAAKDQPLGITYRTWCKLADSC